MENVLKKVKKSHLVTVCSTYNDGFSSFFQPFTYEGHSRSEKTHVVVSFPSYPENLMFYEHFESYKHSLPSRLSFMFLGGDNRGEINFDFRGYLTVVVMDVSNDFMTVNSLFWILNSLPKCQELRIYLNNKNIQASKEDLLMLESLESNIKKNLMTKYISASVKTLTITQVEDIDRTVLTSKSRVDVILDYARNFLPKLEHFSVEINATGRTYDILNNFCKLKGLLPSHKLVMKDGKVTCRPPSPTSIPTTAPEAYSRGNFTETGVKAKDDYYKNSRPSTMPKDDILPGKPRQTDGDLMRPLANLNRPVNNHDLVDTSLKQEQEPEVLEVEVTPKLEIIPVINISDEEDSPTELEEPVAKKPRELDVGNYDLYLPQPPPSITNSQTSTISVSSATPVIKNEEQGNSLTSIGTDYNEWERSSSDEEERSTAKSRCDLSVVQESTIIAVAQKYNITELQNILSMANATKTNVVEVEPTSRPEDRRTRRRQSRSDRSSRKFVDHGTFERRKR